MRASSEDVLRHRCVHTPTNATAGDLLQKKTKHFRVRIRVFLSIFTLSDAKESQNVESEKFCHAIVRLRLFIATSLLCLPPECTCDRAGEMI